MQSFERGGIAVRFWSISGEVIDSQKFSETVVTSTGGGGYIGRHGGQVSAPQVSSRNQIHHEFWLRMSDGSEKSFKFRGIDVPLRTGQRITLISVGKAEQSDGWFAILVNHASGHHHFLLSGDEVASLLKIETEAWKAGLTGLALSLLMGWVSSAWGWAVVAGIALACCLRWRSKRQAQAWSREFLLHAEGVAQQRLSAAP